MNKSKNKNARKPRAFLFGIGGNAMVRYLQSGLFQVI